MVISRTPFRISFFGGGTDYPAWYRNHGGAVLAATINKYCYLTCRFLPPFFDHRFRVVWSKIENCQSIGDISHPAVRAVLTHANVRQGMEIHHDGDLPARSGTGSSSAFAVGLLHAVHALHGRMKTKDQLAEDALYIEQEMLQESVGSQDQVMAAHGGFNHIAFHSSGRIAVAPVALRRERLAELESHLMLLFTGSQRTSSNVASEYISAVETQPRALERMMELTQEGLALLQSRNDLSTFGALLDESWALKRSLGPSITNPSIDAIYRDAQRLGAIGGKISGAGGGGFMLLFVPPDRQAALREHFRDYVHVPFRFESSGSRILFHEIEEDFEWLDRRRRDFPLQPFRDLDHAHHRDRAHHHDRVHNHDRLPRVAEGGE